jgi:putative transposase
MSTVKTKRLSKKVWAPKTVLQVRLYPNKTQKKELFRQFEINCELYNYCLQEKIDSYKDTGTSPSCFDQIKAHALKFKQNTNSTSLHQTIRRLDKAFSAFFRRVKSGETPGYPRFKKKIKSLDFKIGDGSKIVGNKLRIQHVGSIKMVNHRNVTKFSRVTVKFVHGDWYAFFVCEKELEILPPSQSAIGLDFGLKTFVATSNGEKISSPMPLRANIKKLAKMASRRDKAPIKSKERKRLNRVLRNLHRRILNIRTDFNHKLSRKLVNQYGIIVIEDLAIEELKTEISNINRTYDDVAWGQFSSMLTYKAANAGRSCVKVNPAFTSQTCSCGARTPHDLSKRLFRCGACGREADRDVNAAQNILALGLQCRAL